MSMTAALPHDVPPPDIRRLMLWLSAGLMVIALWGSHAFVQAEYDGLIFLSWHYFWTQDVFVLTALVAGLFWLSLSLRMQPQAVRRPWRHEPHCIAGAAIALVGAAWLGHHVVFEAYAVSRDEQMVLFDAAIYGQGRLFWALPEGWRPLADALNQTFIQPIGRHEAWVSAYLPVNALLHAGMAQLGAIDLTAPLLAGTALLALWRICLRLWPQDADVRAVVLLLCLLSAQLLFMAMTPYAMTAHLAFNLLWLWMFLRDDRRGLAATLVIGFLATGLHQPVFHPLFVAPFLLMLMQQRRWRRLGVYVVTYGAIGLFWLAWPQWISAHGVAPAVIGQGSGEIGYLARLLHVWEIGTAHSLELMMLNLLRFLTWQHLLFAPLLAAGLMAARRDNPLAEALAMGLILHVLAMMLLLPYQGYAMGYRYLHGVLGSGFLLAGFGYAWLRAQRYDLRRPLLVSSLVTAGLVMPFLGFRTHQMTAVFATLDARMRASTADMVIVEDRAAPFVRDLVRNRPDLGNRPLRLLGSNVMPGDIRRFCAAHSLSFVTTPDLHPVVLLFRRESSVPRTDFLALMTAARQAGCTVQPLPSAAHRR